MNYGIRQGDLISCPLYIAVIEGLAILLIINYSISEIKIAEIVIKIIIYTNDTTIVIKD